MGIKEIFLNKGWAGTTMSRAETVERVNPLIRKHHVLNNAYNFAIDNVSEPEVARELESLQKTARGDLGKLSETVLSAGGVSYNGVDLDPDEVGLDSDEDSLVRGLLDLEDDFQRDVSSELKANHHIRTRAILSVVQANSAARQEYLQRVSRQLLKAH